MYGHTAVVAVLALALAAPLFAGDIVGMPTGNTVKPGEIELNAIWWNQRADPGEGERIIIGELFFGVHERLELNVLHADVKDIDSYTEVNAYATVLKERVDRPSLIVGVTNVFGADWLPGAAARPDTHDDPSFFAVTSYNLALPPGPPTPQEPLIRMHAGWGDGWHDSRFFGGLQFLVDPKFGGAVLNYKDMPAYMLTWRAMDRVELTGGFFGGDAFYRVGAFLNW